MVERVRLAPLGTYPRGMSQPGWYPDPAGQPGHYRHWDGAQWSAQTSTSPHGDPPSSGGWGGRLLVALVIVVVLALIAWVLHRQASGGSAPEDTNSSTPTVSAWDETSTPTPTPTPSEPESSGGDEVACPGDGSTVPQPGERDGRYHGGGLSYPAVPGWEARQGWGVDWLQDRDGQATWVAKDWLALTVVGQVDTAVFRTPRNAASQIINCLATSYYYERFQSRTDVSSEAITVDGRRGWKVAAEVRVGGYSVEGDVITVVALDVGRPGKLAVFVGEAPIGDADRQRLVDDAIKGLKVVG